MVAELERQARPDDLCELLQLQARRYPSKLACAYLNDNGDIHSSYSFEKLDLAARALAARLQGLDARGEAAVLLYPPGLDFIVAFFACIYAEVIAIPLPMPRSESGLHQTKGIIGDTGANVILSTRTFISKLSRQDKDYFNDLISVDTQAVDPALAQAWFPPSNIDSARTAYLQYTSGSTSDRKGVMISHANVIENIIGIDRGFRHDGDSIAVNWLPHFHDLGLVSGILQPIYHGVSNYLMAPTALVQKPIRWLQAISDFKATHTNSPNYAYDLCIKKISEEQQQKLDLSAWRVALNGAEPVRAETVRLFYEKFRAAGLSKSTMYPAYGLAEATLVVSAPKPGSEPRIMAVDNSALERGLISPAAGDNQRELVACGEALDKTVIAIVDPQSGEQLGEDRVGEIWVSGPAVASGYWRNETATEDTFRASLADYPGARFLRTGDLGFLNNKQLYITGREKDLIIVRGANHYPQDIEWTVENADPAFRAGCGAAFSVQVEGQEKLVVVSELEREYLKKADVKELARVVSQRIATEHELQLHGLVLLKTATVPRTSSGKIQRRLCKRHFLENELVEVARWMSDERTSEPEAAMVSAPPASGPSVDADGLINWLREYSQRRLDSSSYDERRLIPPHIFLDFGNRGILGLQASTDYGGVGLSTTDTLRVIQQLGAIDLTLAMMTIVHNTLGIEPIQSAATADTKRKLLPRLASGRELVAFAITEAGAGSNPRAITTTAVQIDENRWRLGGEKIWSGSAGWASVINVVAQHVDLNGERRGMIAFAVPVKLGGVNIGPEAKTFGMRGMVQNKISFENVLIDRTCLLGEPGGGMQVAQRAMQRGRLMIAAACVGGLKRCVQLMTRYASRRTISTGNLLENGLWLNRIAELSYQAYALETYAALVGTMEDRQKDISADIFAALKILAPEYLWQAADGLMQILGGRGYMEQNIAPQILRDARVARILEGPTEALQMFLGARVCRAPEPYYAFLTETLKDQSVVQQMRNCIEKNLDVHGHEHEYLCAVGGLAAHALLLASLRGQEIRPDQQVNLHRESLQWANERFLEHIAKLDAYSASAVKTSDLLETVESYSQSIGDIEQRLSGFDEELDPLLRTMDLSPGAKETQDEPGTLAVNSALGGADKDKAQSNKQTQADGSVVATEIENFVVEWLDKELKLPNGRVKPSDTFFEHGVDSVVSVMLTVAIEENFGYLPEPELVYDYPRISDCAAEISRHIQSAKA